MEWKFIEGFDRQYSVSSTGLIRSNFRWYLNPKTLERHIKVRELIMTPNVSKFGYERIKLSDRKIHFVHKLVASAFYGDGSGLFVNHINGIKTDNRVENLEWVTTQENNQHAWDTGLHQNTREAIVKASAKNYQLRNPQGAIVDIYNMADFCRKNNLTHALIHHLFLGKQKHHKGWTLV